MCSDAVVSKQVIIIVMHLVGLMAEACSLARLRIV